MKWFIRGLSHYADFSGRARRKEYWMFLLFNLIFAFVWTILLMIVFTLAKSGNPPAIEIAVNIAYLSYGILIMLPSLSLAVRRLHDVGKSGWMLFIMLIPFIGGIWLLVLMLIDGQQGDNKYGPNPKTSPETFSDRSKLKSAGVTLIAASSVTLIFTIIFTWILPVIHHSAFYFSNTYFLIQNIFSFAATVILLIAGFRLLNEKTIINVREKKNNAIVLLLIAVSIPFVLGVLSFISNLKHLNFTYGFNTLIHILSYLSVALFAASILFSSQNKNLIRKAALTAIIFTSLCLFAKVYVYMDINARNGSQVIYQLQNLFATFYILGPAAFIVFTATFYLQEGSVEEGKKEQVAPQKQTVKKDAGAATHFPPYNGSGVCDVCNRPLSGLKAYIVPNNVFYSSRKYRDYIRNGPMAMMMGIPVNDAYFAQMQARDTSAGSAICENCIHMFS